MHISNELRVGIMFFTGLVLLVLLIATLTRWGQDRNAYIFTIRFSQAQGIQTGADVRVAGVKVGQVNSISLDPRTNVALVTVRVLRGVRLYAGYAYTIGIGGLVGERYVEIDPTNRDGHLVSAGDLVDGLTTADLNDLINNANTVVTKLTSTADSINSLLGDKRTQQNLKSAIANLQRTTAASAQFATTLSHMALRNERSVDAIVSDLQSVAHDVRMVSEKLTGGLQGSQFMSNLELASQNVASLTKRLDTITISADRLLNDKELLGNLRDTSAHLKVASAALEDTMNQAKIAAAGLPAISTNLQTATGDLPGITKPIRDVAPATAANVLAISNNLRAASQGLSGLAQRVSQAASIFTALNIEPEARLMYQPQSDSTTRSDLNVNISGASSMLRLGVTDIGKDTQMNVQFGKRLQQDAWFRFGIIQSSFGLGADYQPNPNLRLSGEIFDPGRLRANGIVDYRLKMLGEGWWLTTAWYDAFNHGRLGLGVTLRP